MQFDIIDQSTGQSVAAIVPVAANAFSVGKFNIKRTDSHGAGAQYEIDLSAPTPLDVSLLGNLDSTGQKPFVIGPSGGSKGDISVTVSVGPQKKTFTLRYGP